MNAQIIITPAGRPINGPASRPIFFPKAPVMPVEPAWCLRCTEELALPGSVDNLFQLCQGCANAVCPTDIEDYKACLVLYAY